LTSSNTTTDPVSAITSESMPYCPSSRLLPAEQRIDHQPGNERAGDADKHVSQPGRAGVGRA
jgi:hypothetical protein